MEPGGRIGFLIVYNLCHENFHVLINAIYWLWLIIVPTGVFGLVGYVFYEKNKENLPYCILLTLIGLVLGVLWAERVRKKHGLSDYFSRIMATPDLDKRIRTTKK